jgi:hypothetical protein
MTSLQRNGKAHATLTLLESASFKPPVVATTGNHSSQVVSHNPNGTSSNLSTLTKSLGLDSQPATAPATFVSNKNTPIMMTPEQPEEDDYSTPLVEFERQERVVIVTKIHGPDTIQVLEQMLCLLTQAYNERTNYDVLIFTTMPFSQAQIKVVQAMGVSGSANVTIVKDNPGLHTMMDQLSPVRKAKFMKRCGLKTPQDIDKVDFSTHCQDPPLRGRQRLSYTWQCEFRSLHIWKRPELAPYQTMLWMDTDAFCTKVWDRDPIAYFIKHKLVIFFDNWPGGSSHGRAYQNRYQKAFNRSLCGLELEHGHFKPMGSANCTPQDEVPQIHGFFHITNLDFFRSQPVRHWTKTLIGNAFLSRRFDDQLAVTIPTAILAPNRSWDMYSHGFRLQVFHNFEIDGKPNQKVGGFQKFWRRSEAANNFTQAHRVCHIVDAGR